MYSRYILRKEIITEAVRSLCIIISIYITLVAGWIQNTAHRHLFVNFPNVAATTQPTATVLNGHGVTIQGPTACEPSLSNTWSDQTANSLPSHSLNNI